MNIDGINTEIDIITELSQFKEEISSEFILLLSDAWSYAINPFNNSEVSAADKALGTFNMVDNDNNAFQVSKLYSGNEHDRQIVHLSKYFKVEENHYLNLSFNAKIIQYLRKNLKQVIPSQTEIGMYMDCPFMERNLNVFRDFEYAYHQFMMDLVAQQVLAIQRIMVKNTCPQLYVEGKFSVNSIYMNLLSEAFFNSEVFAVEKVNVSTAVNQDKKVSKLNFKKY